MFGDLSEEECREFLEQNIYGRIGCHAFGKTYVVPISYAYKGGKLYCHTYDGLKMQMMRNNPSVCFEVDVINPMGGWKSVIAQGVFTEVDGKDREEGLKVLLERKVPAMVSETVKLSSDWPFSPEDFSKIPGLVFQVDIKEVTGRFEKSDAIVK